MEIVNFQSKISYSNRYNDSYLDHMGYPSKLRQCSFNRLNTNENPYNTLGCNSITQYLILKNSKNIPIERKGGINIEGESLKATLSHEHSIHETGSKLIEEKNNEDFQDTNNVTTVIQNNNSNNINTITTCGSTISRPTNFEFNGSSGSKAFEDTSTTNILNITNLKSNFDRVVRRYRMKQKKLEDDKLS